MRPPRPTAPDSVSVRQFITASQCGSDRDALGLARIAMAWVGWIPHGLGQLGIAMPREAAQIATAWDGPDAMIACRGVRHVTWKTRGIRPDVTD